MAFRERSLEKYKIKEGIGSMPDHLEVCEAAARAGGRVLTQWLGRFRVSSKGPADLVTEADIASQSEIRRIVESAFPAYGFVGEEQSVSERSASLGAPRWIVDPLDGTTNYVHGYPAYCVSVALAHGDAIIVGVIYDPVSEECFTAEVGRGAYLNSAPIKVARTSAIEDALVAVSFPPQVAPESIAVIDFLAALSAVHSIRRSGSSAINLAYVASGRLDAFWVRRISSWDVAAGLLLVSEAGGVVGPFLVQHKGITSGESLKTTIALPKVFASGTVPLDNPVFIAACSLDVLDSLQRLLCQEPSGGSS